MSTKYCVNCDRVIAAKRQIGIGTFLLVLVTAGFWLLIIPFYSKKCPMCKASNFGTRPILEKSDYKVPGKSETIDPMEQIKKLQELKVAGAITEDEFQIKKKKIFETI